MQVSLFHQPINCVLADLFGAFCTELFCGKANNFDGRLPDHLANLLNSGDPACFLASRFDFCCGGFRVRQVVKDPLSPWCFHIRYIGVSSRNGKYCTVSYGFVGAGCGTLCAGGEAASANECALR